MSGKHHWGYAASEKLGAHSKSSLVKKANLYRSQNLVRVQQTHDDLLYCCSMFRLVKQSCCLTFILNQYTDQYEFAIRPLKRWVRIYVYRSSIY